VVKRARDLHGSGGVATAVADGNAPARSKIKRQRIGVGMRFMLRANGVAESVAIGASSLRTGCRYARRGRARVACLIAVGILTGIVAQTARANWTKVSLSPSTTEPYFACPPTSESGHASCQAIIDPTPETHVRGPLRAGADHSSASPSLEGGGVGGGFSPANLRSAYNLPSTSALGSRRDMSGRRGVLARASADADPLGSPGDPGSHTTARSSTDV
jgi:hypothetical protein